MSESGIEWIPSPKGLERTIRVGFWLILALVLGFSGTTILSLQGLTATPPLLGLGFAFGLLGATVTIFAVLRLSRVRPGIFELGVSRDGLSVRYPFSTRTFAWSDLWWSSDGIHVEGRWWWGGPGLLTLSPAQLERIQRAVYLH
ncbi:MAG: hypothetical protein WA688_01835 [Thermoplasmata archaeon]